jgi:hypothetical protein
LNLPSCRLAGSPVSTIMPNANPGDAGPHVRLSPATRSCQMLALTNAWQPFGLNLAIPGSVAAIQTAQILHRATPVGIWQEASGWAGPGRAAALAWPNRHRENPNS